MNRSAVALAVCAAFAAPAAFADVTISGAINMGIEYLNVGDASSNYGGNRDGQSNFGISNNYSNVTISSTDDLGGGLKLDFAFQIQTANDTAGGNLTNRNSHIGLVSESWGGVWYGSNENIYERYFYSIDPIDAAAGLGGNLQMMGNPGGQAFCNAANRTTQGNAGDGCYSWYRRDSDSIWYDSPNFNGFTFGAVWMTDDNRPAKTAGVDVNPQGWEVGAKYVGPTLPLQAWLAYGERNDEFGLESFVANGRTGQFSVTATDGSKDTALHGGVGYTVGDIFLFVDAERLEYKLDGVATGDIKKWTRNAYSVGTKWNLATGYVGAQYILASDASCDLEGGGGCADNDTGGQMIGLGYYHNLSKQTQAYVVASWIDNKDNANYGTAGISNGANFTNLGSTIYGLGVGLKHSF